MTTVTAAWGAIRASLQTLGFHDIKGVVGLAGLDVFALARVRQEEGASKGQLMSAVDGVLGKLDPTARQHAVAIIVDALLKQRPGLADALADDLARLGWGLVDGRLIPLELFDPTELAALPDASRADLVKAAQRLRDGDLSGAIAAACGAVDSAVAAVYAQHGLGDPTDASFQEGCNRALAAVAHLEAPLRGLGWDEATLKPFLANFKGALNHGAYVMQTLRSKMGDVHGTKPILKALVFDALKWAELFVRTLTVQ